MHDADPSALVCSGRPGVGEAVAGALAAAGAASAVARRRREWPADPPSMAVLDLADRHVSVAEARMAFGEEAYLVALVEEASPERLISALAAGCRDYLFHPAPTRDVQALWRRFGEERERSRRPSPGIRGRLELEFPSDVRFVRDVVDEVVRACERLAFAGARARLNLRVALGEAVANAILYGNREDPEKRVRVSAELGAGAARVVVTDEGTGFDPEAVEDPTEPENRARSGGRGVFLLRALADEVEFNETGNAVTLTLRA